MGRTGQQILGFFLAFGALAIAASVLMPRALGLAAGPEAEITRQLKRSEQRATELQLDWTEAPTARLRPHRSHYDRITVQVAEDRIHAVATATLDWDGTLGDVRVSSLGFEEIPFTLKEGDWVPDAGLAPRLTGALAALEARRRALEQLVVGEQEGLNRLRAPDQSDGGATPDDGRALERLSRVEDRRYQVVAWFIRGERGEVRVTERYRLTGRLPEAPVDERSMVQLRLVRRGREFFFVSALM